jgi:prepilin-type N-terminal cleavage/methylation domain-containing protein
MKTNQGFTYIELLIYIVILSILLTGAIQFMWNITYTRAKSNTMQEYNQNMRYLSQRLSYEIRNASAVNTAVGSSLSLAFADSTRNPTIFTLNSGRVYVGFGSSGSCPTTSPCPITSNKININSLVFANYSTGDTKSINIDYSISATNPNTNSRAEYNYSGTYNGSAELRLK